MDNLIQRPSDFDAASYHEAAEAAIRMARNKAPWGEKNEIEKWVKRRGPASAKPVPRRAGRIVSLPSVADGDPCVRGTRIPVWTIERARRSGLNETQICEMYPSLTNADVLAAFGYADAYPQDIQSQIQANEDA